MFSQLFLYTCAVGSSQSELLILLTILMEVMTHFRILFFKNEDREETPKFPVRSASLKAKT